MKTGTTYDRPLKYNGGIFVNEELEYCDGGVERWFKDAIVCYKNYENR